MVSYFRKDPEDFLNPSQAINGFNSPADVILQGVSQKFDIDYDKIIRKAELMGIDMSDPEMAGNLFKRLARRLRKRIKARIKARRKRRGKSPAFRYSVTAPEGTATYSDQGLSFVRPGPGTTGPGQYPMQIQRGNIGGNMMAQIQKNPLLLAIPAGVIYLLLDAAKKKPVETSK